MIFTVLRRDTGVLLGSEVAYYLSAPGSADTSRTAIGLAGIALLLGIVLLEMFMLC